MTRCIPMMKPVPPEFWNLLSDDQFHRLCQGEPLTNKRLIKRLWKMVGRSDKPPEFLDFVFDRKQFEDLLAQRKRLN
jgi:hypothetical protein